MLNRERRYGKPEGTSHEVVGDVEIKHIEKVHAVDNETRTKLARSSCWQVVKRNAFLEIRKQVSILKLAEIGN